MWRQLHDRPEQTGGDFSGEKIWLETFQQTIPCSECSAHCRQYFFQFPPDLRSIAHYFRYTWIFHNVVNRRKRYPIVPWQPHWGTEPDL
jgi:hypothetical protein